jgi:hypothetical protein
LFRLKRKGSPETGKAEIENRGWVHGIGVASNSIIGGIERVQSAEVFVERIGRQTVAVPIGIASEQMVLFVERIVPASGVLRLIAAKAHVPREVIHVAGQIRRAPLVHQDNRRGIEAGGWNDVPRKWLPRWLPVRASLQSL